MHTFWPATKPVDADDKYTKWARPRSAAQGRRKFIFSFVFLFPSLLIFAWFVLVGGGYGNGWLSTSASSTKRDTEADVEVDKNVPQSSASNVIPVLVIACNRPQISRCLTSLLKHRPDQSSGTKFPIIVSQDCVHEETSAAIRSFGDQIVHLRQPDQSEPETPQQHQEFGAYYRIARHYRWALNQMFHSLNFDQAIIVEDDMEVAPDFFHYFAAFLPLLKSDPTLMCISAWNDNGKTGLVNDTTRFYRSDFFPGLGWMLTRDLWQELEPKWPRTFWDDWLRHPDNRRNRHCIFPEVSRTFNFGKKGVSGGLFYEQHIGRIVLNPQPVLFTGFHRDRLLSYKLQPPTRPFDGQSSVDVRWYLPESYDNVFHRSVYEYSTPTDTNTLRALLDSEQPQQSPLYTANRNLKHQRTADTNPSNNNEPTQKKNTDEQHNSDTVEPIITDPTHIHDLCGPQCSRSFVLYYPPGDYSAGKHGLGAQVRLLEQWSLMDDIREDVARVSYRGVVVFKQKFRTIHEWVRVYIAPERR